VLGPNPLQTSVWSTAISATPTMSLAGSFTNVDELLPTVPECDVVLLNAAQQVEQGVEWVRQITRTHPDSRIVVAGIPSHEHVILAYIEAGALAYVPQEETVERVLEALPAVLRGEAFVAPDVAPALIGRLTRLRQAYIEPETAGSRLGTLTPRERQVLELLAQCLSNREIADRLLIEIGTVKNHVHNVLDKLSMSNRRQAASYLRVCVDNGLAPKGGASEPAGEAVGSPDAGGTQEARGGERPGNGRAHGQPAG
jgi:two-component system NarL family response regulator